MGRGTNTGTPFAVRMRKFWRRDKYLLFLVLPGLLLLLIFRYVPIYGIVISFMNYNPFDGIFGSDWVGFKHFVDFFQDPFFGRVVGNTFILGFLSLLFSFPAPIIFALLLNEIKAKRFKKATQTISYLPYFLSTVIVVGIVRRLCSMDGGFINLFLQNLGLQPIGFLIEPQWFRPLYIISGIWQGMGYGAIIYLAALSGVDMEIYEAATIDGANRFQMLCKITIPSILPTVCIMFIMAVGGILGNDFTKILLLYSEGTYVTADVISTYTYRQGIEMANYSYSSAIGLMNSVVSVVFLVGANFIVKKLSDSENSLF